MKWIYSPALPIQVHWMEIEPAVGKAQQCAIGTHVARNVLLALLRGSSCMCRHAGYITKVAHAEILFLHLSMLLCSGKRRGRMTNFDFIHGHKYWASAMSILCRGMANVRTKTLDKIIRLRYSYKQFFTAFRGVAGETIMFKVYEFSICAFRAFCKRFQIESLVNHFIDLIDRLYYSSFSIQRYAWKL